MKRYKIWFVLLLCLMVGCGNGQSTDGEKTAENLTQTEAQTKEENVTPTQTEAPKRSEIVLQNTSTGQQLTLTSIPEEETDELLFAYNKFGGYVEDMCIAEDGTLYAICLWGEDKQYRLDEPIEITKSQQRLCAFDENGKRVWQMDVMLPIFPSTDLSYLVTQDAIVEWSDGCLYIVLRGLHKMPVLYRLNVETWEWQELYCFERFSRINKLVFMGDKLYVHGLLENPEEKTIEQEIQRLTWSPDTYQGQAIGYMDMENLNAGVTLLPIDIPQDMIKLTEDTLGIYQMGEDAEYFWKYNPSEEIWEKTDIAVSYYRSTLEDAEKKAALCEMFAGYGDGCFYVKDFTNICYETADGTELLQFKSSDGFVYHLKSDGTFLYYYYHENAKKGIRRIRISELFEHFAEEE